MLVQLCSALNEQPCWAIVPISYVIYRSTRTALALLQAILIYWIAPCFYSPNLAQYKHRWTVVSGGTDGIGKAYMFELAQRGLRKFLLLGRSEEKLERVKAELEDKYPGIRMLTLLFDFNRAVEPDYADKMRRAFEQIDVGLAVNSVGVGRELLERFGDRPEADRQLFRVNAIGAAEFISAVLPSMERGDGGQLVVLSSSQGFRPIPLLAAYSATKSFISFISEAVDREYASAKIRVQCLTPALVATSMTYYKNGSLFVVTPEKFACEAVNTLGLVRMTSGCFNHEIQMLLRHLFPWAILKHLIMPIYWHHQKRMIRLHNGNGTTKNGTNQKNVKFMDKKRATGLSPPSSPRHSKIPTWSANGNFNNAAAYCTPTNVRHRA